MSMMYMRTFLNAATGLVWHDGENSCVLRDDSRYFGHAVKSRLWCAYRATKPATADDKLTYLGRFRTREQAKEALIQAVAPSISTLEEARLTGPAAVEEAPRVRTAGC